MTVYFNFAKRAYSYSAFCESGAVLSKKIKALQVLCLDL